MHFNQALLVMHEEPHVVSKVRMSKVFLKGRFSCSLAWTVGLIANYLHELCWIILLHILIQLPFCYWAAAGVADELLALWVTTARHYFHWRDGKCLSPKRYASIFQQPSKGRSGQIASEAFVRNRLDNLGGFGFERNAMFPLLSLRGFALPFWLDVFSCKWNAWQGDG